MELALFIFIYSSNVITILFELKFKELFSGKILITLGAVLSISPPDGIIIFAHEEVKRTKHI